MRAIPKFAPMWCLRKHKTISATEFGTDATESPKPAYHSAKQASTAPHGTHTPETLAASISRGGKPLRTCTLVSTRGWVGGAKAPAGNRVRGVGCGWVGGKRQKSSMRLEMQTKVETRFN